MDRGFTLLHTCLVVTSFLCTSTCGYSHASDPDGSSLSYSNEDVIEVPGYLIEVPREYQTAKKRDIDFGTNRMREGNRYQRIRSILRSSAGNGK